MNILIHDLKDINPVLNSQSDELIIISDNGKIQPCFGCFKCWIETPGKCVLDDGYNTFGPLLSKCDKLIGISQCFYGGYSPFVKNVVERISDAYLLPYFEIRNKEMHHPKRYNNTINLEIHFYGAISNAERETAKNLVIANGVNLDAKTNIYFYNTPE
jgi:multimeric flavodoxin WrbA